MHHLNNMKQSLVNDTGLRATKPVDAPNPREEGVTGPTMSPSERLLKGKLVSFKNAEESDAPKLKSYNFEE